MASARTRADARAAALSWSARCDGRRTIAAPSTGAGWSMYLSVANASPNARQFAAAMSRDNHVLRLCGCISTEDNVGPEWTGLMPVLWERRKDRGRRRHRHPPRRASRRWCSLVWRYRVSCSQVSPVDALIFDLPSLQTSRYNTHGAHDAHGRGSSLPTKTLTLRSITPSKRFVPLCHACVVCRVSARPNPPSTHPIPSTITPSRPLANRQHNTNPKHTPPSRHSSVNPGRATNLNRSTHSLWNG